MYARLPFLSLLIVFTACFAGAESSDDQFSLAWSEYQLDWTSYSKLFPLDKHQMVEELERQGIRVLILEDEPELDLGFHASLLKAFKSRFLEDHYPAVNFEIRGDELRGYQNHFSRYEDPFGRVTVEGGTFPPRLYPVNGIDDPLVFRPILQITIVVRDTFSRLTLLHEAMHAWVWKSIMAARDLDRVTRVIYG